MPSGTRIPQLTEEQLAALADELDEIRRELVDDLGDKDAAYIRGIITAQQRLEALGRGLLWAGWFPPAWLAGTAALSVAKILDNMEIGPKVMNGEHEWRGAPT